jgi:hypothetical protein
MYNDQIPTVTIVNKKPTAKVQWYNHSTFGVDFYSNTAMWYMSGALDQQANEVLQPQVYSKC